MVHYSNNEPDDNLNKKVNPTLYRNFQGNTSERSLNNNLCNESQSKRIDNSKRSEMMCYLYRHEKKKVNLSFKRVSKAYNNIVSERSWSRNRYWHDEILEKIDQNITKVKQRKQKNDKVILGSKH